MSDQIHQAPRAPHPNAPPTSTSTSTPAHAEASHANFSRPATAINGPPRTAPSATTFPPPQTHVPAATTEPSTFNERLNNADRYWKFKGAFYTVAIIVGLIGIGTFGWLMSTAPILGYTYGYGSTYALWPSLLTFSSSVIWSAACILVLVLRKRPTHPGLRVAIDLILWLGFIATALFALIAYADLVTWGEYGEIDGYGWNGYGEYELAGNGTWVWTIDASYVDSSYESNPRECDKNATSRYSEYVTPFANCVELDAYVNTLWQAKPHRVGVAMTGVVCQFFGLVVHLALFIWACVDCHHHNRSKTSKDAEKIAASIVQTMITNGAIVPPPGQAHVRPQGPWGAQQMGYYQLPPQGQQQAYPLATMYPQRMPVGQPGPQEYRAPQGVAGPASGVAGPSGEKSEGPRYA